MKTKTKTKQNNKQQQQQQQQKPKKKKNLFQPLTLPDFLLMKTIHEKSIILQWSFIM